MPSVEHLAGSHDKRLDEVHRLAIQHGWTGSVIEGYERQLSPAARAVLSRQTNLSSHAIRNRPDLLLIHPDYQPIRMDVKTTTFRSDTGYIAIELFPVCRAIWDTGHGEHPVFDLDGYFCHIEDLQKLVRRIVIPSSRWKDGSDGFQLYHAMARGGSCDGTTLDPTFPDTLIHRTEVSSTDASGDPFVLVPRDAFDTRHDRTLTRTETFLGTRKYHPPNLHWPLGPVSMTEADPSWTFEEWCVKLWFEPTNNNRAWWLRNVRKESTP